MRESEIFTHWSFGTFPPGSISREKYTAFQTLHTQSMDCFAILARIEALVLGVRTVDWYQVEDMVSELIHRIRRLVDLLQVMDPVRFMDAHDWVAKICFYARLSTAATPVPATPPYTESLLLRANEECPRVPLLRLKPGWTEAQCLWITPALFQYVLEANELRQRIDDLLRGVDLERPEDVAGTSRRLTEMVRGAKLPERLREELEIAAVEAAPYGRSLDFLVVAGEGRAACLLKTLPAVAAAEAVPAWLAAAACKYSPEALRLRLSQGLADGEQGLSVAAVPAGSARFESVAHDTAHSSRALVQRLERVLPHVSALNLFASPGQPLRPRQCRSLHDLVCLCLDRGLDRIFSFVGKPSLGLGAIKQVHLEIPVTMNLFNLGGGLFPSAAEKIVVNKDDIRSVPAWSLLMGLSCPQMLWPSVVPGPDGAQSRHCSSYAAVSQSYLYCVLRLGRNLYTVECDCREDALGFLRVVFKAGGGSLRERIVRREAAAAVFEQERFGVRVFGDYLEAERSDVDDVALQRGLVNLGLLIAWIQTASPEKLATLVDPGGMQEFRRIVNASVSGQA